MGDRYCSRGLPNLQRRVPNRFTLDRGSTAALRLALRRLRGAPGVHAAFRITPRVKARCAEACADRVLRQSGQLQVVRCTVTRAEPRPLLLCPATSRAVW